MSVACAQYAADPQWVVISVMTVLALVGVALIVLTVTMLKWLVDEQRRGAG